MLDRRRALAVGGLVRAVTRRWRRLRYADTVNSPYLSGDLFRSLCEATLDDSTHSRLRFVETFQRARTLFVKTDRLPEFLRDFAPRADACRVLITGNSDLELHETPPALPRQLHRWFAQNSFITSDMIRPLPIGLENQALGQNGLLHHVQRCSDEDLAAKQLRLFAAFAPSHPERDGLLEHLAQSPVVDVEYRRLPPRQFHARLRSYRFVVAPRGNGVDTHRFWEALYADAIPVTRATPWSRAIKAEGLPIVEIDDWNELLAWSHDDLARQSAALPKRPSATPWLWEPFWRERLSTLVNARPPGGSQ